MNFLSPYYFYRFLFNCVDFLVIIGTKKFYNLKGKCEIIFYVYLKRYEKLVGKKRSQEKIAN